MMQADDTSHGVGFFIAHRSSHPLSHAGQFHFDSVFRGLIIGGAEKPGTDFFEKFYGPTSYPNWVVFDPFMGSGTTVHEAVKLGATAIGSDINPVAVALVRTAADEYSRTEVMQAFQHIRENCKDKIQHYNKLRKSE